MFFVKVTDYFPIFILIYMLGLWWTDSERNIINIKL